jgi:hypothetical protein
MMILADGLWFIFPIFSVVLVKILAALHLSALCRPSNTVLKLPHSGRT